MIANEFNKAIDELNKIYFENETKEKLIEDKNNKNILKFDTNSKAFIISKKDWEDWDW